MYSEDPAVGFQADPASDLEQYYPQPIVARPYASPQTEAEVNSSKVKTGRPLLKYYITQKRYGFGKPIEFSDRPQGEKIAEYRRQNIPGYALEREEHDAGFQAAPELVSSETQTSFSVKVNKATQYHPISMPAADAARALAKAHASGFLQRASALAEHALEHNETFDILRDELAVLEQASSSDAATALGHRTENALKPMHAFQDLQFSRHKLVTSVQWHPARVGLVSFACAHKKTHDQWVDLSSKVMNSAILVWDFADLLHPHIVLEVPGNVTTFSWLPSYPNICVAGLQSGQVCVWDLSSPRVRILVAPPPSATALHLLDPTVGVRSSSYTSSSTATGVAGSGASSDAAGGRAGQGKGVAAGAAGAPGADGDEKADGSASTVVCIPPVAVSLPERSHSRPVTDLVVLPPHIDLNRRGECVTQRSGAQAPMQFITVAGDGKILYWDVDSLRAAAPPVHTAVTATSSTSASVADDGGDDDAGAGDGNGRGSRGLRPQAPAGSAAPGGSARRFGVRSSGRDSGRGPSGRPAAMGAVAAPANDAAVDAAPAKKDDAATTAPAATSAAAGASGKKNGEEEGPRVNPHIPLTPEVRWAPFFVLPLVRPGANLPSSDPASAGGSGNGNGDNNGNAGGGILHSQLLLATRIALGPDMDVVLGTEDGEVAYARYAFTSKDYRQSKEGLEAAAVARLVMKRAIGLPHKKATRKDGAGAPEVSGSDALNAESAAGRRRNDGDAESDDDSDDGDDDDEEGSDAEGKEGGRDAALGFGRSLEDDDEDDASAPADDPELGGSAAPSRRRAVRHLVPITTSMRPAMVVQRNPHIPDLYLIAGGWGFSLWQKDRPFALFTSPDAGEAVTCAAWSPSRAAIVAVGRADGTVDIWDLLDSAQKPTTFQVGNDRITSLHFWQSSGSSASISAGITSGPSSAVVGNGGLLGDVSSGAGAAGGLGSGASSALNAVSGAGVPSTAPDLQLLAVGDAAGKLHVLELPRFLRRATPKEAITMREVCAKEIRRLRYARKAKRAAGLPRKPLNISALLSGMEAGFSSLSGGPEGDNETKISDSASPLAGLLNPDHVGATGSLGSAGSKTGAFAATAGGRAGAAAAAAAAASAEEWGEAEQRAEMEYQMMFKDFRKAMGSKDSLAAPVDKPVVSAHGDSDAPHEPATGETDMDSGADD